MATLGEQKEKEVSKSYGKPKIGGPFDLINAETEQRFSSNELAGRFYMVYFGFTHCPDICPEELDKMAEVVDMTSTFHIYTCDIDGPDDWSGCIFWIENDKELQDGILVPIFITCDPRRDTPAVVREYIKDFHPDMIGLTGEQDEIRKVAKSFRVYVSSPPNVAEEDDYLVDHSIFFYLMDPEGKFVDCYAKDTTAEEVAASFKNYVKEYLAQGGKLAPK